ncbi:MAG: CapA family protein [Pseudomonadota bacterium]
MLRLICSFFAVALVPLLSTCQTLPEPEDKGWLSGRVLNVEGKPLSASIEIGNQRFTTDDQGRFSISPSEERVYRIEFTADGHYPMRHTFSQAELLRTGELADVILINRKPGRTLFVFGGDAMIGRRFYEPFESEPVLVSTETRLEDSQTLLAEMKPYLERADYASINLETPIFETPPRSPAPKSVTFFSAPETLAALEWAGVDYVALGNNHIYDFLEPGLDLSLDFLRASELDFSGAGKNEEEALAAYRLERGSHAYDFLSYVGWPAGPPTQSAESDKGGAALGTNKNLISTTRASVDSKGIPVIQFHGGLEYVEEPTLSIETKLKQSIDDGAALVIGHHPHVVQGLELYEGKLIAWSLGNFLFDQYFYSAQSAALLYVWMDGDEFHHAEAVPIYIKGYHPTPALGPMRNAINRRLFNLSKKRGTSLLRSGGHMILTGADKTDKPEPRFDVAIDCAESGQRTGHDLLARGDFDAYDLFDAQDRSWLDQDPHIQIAPSEADPTDFDMHIALSKGEPLTTGMRKFQRVFTPGTPMSVRAKVEASGDAKLDVFLQTRATGQTLEDALLNGQKSLIGSASLEASQPIELDLDFVSPRTRARSIRILVNLATDDPSSEVQIDNLELIEWLTPFSRENSSCLDSQPRRQ